VATRFAWDAQHDVDRPAEVAAQRLVAERRCLQPLGVRAHRVVVWKVSAQHVGDLTECGVAHAPGRPVAAHQRELEVELAEAVGRRDVGQTQAAGQGPE
jgi:hypothetical protein